MGNKPLFSRRHDRLGMHHLLFLGTRFAVHLNNALCSANTSSGGCSATRLSARVLKQHRACAPRYLNKGAKQWVVVTADNASARAP